MIGNLTTGRGTDVPAGIPCNRKSYMDSLLALALPFLWTQYVWPALVFVIVLSLVVIVHELGHFLWPSGRHQGRGIRYRHGPQDRQPPLG